MQASGVDVQGDRSSPPEALAPFSGAWVLGRMLSCSWGSGFGPHRDMIYSTSVVLLPVQYAKLGKQSGGPETSQGNLETHQLYNLVISVAEHLVCYPLTLVDKGSE